MYRLVSYCFLVILFSFFLYTPSIKAADIQGIPERIDGKDRFEVAVGISKNWESADYAVITNYLAFADALTAAPLAYKYNAPILLSNPLTLTDATKEELARLKVKKVFVVGGPGSISDQVVSTLRNNGATEVERVGGKDRFEVALNIAKRLGVKDKVFIANGYVFPDALTIAPYAASNEIPILLTNNKTIPVNIEAFIKSSPIIKTWVIGGEGSVGQTIFNHLPSPSRIGGKDRYEVASNVAKAFGQENKRFFLTTGMSFADALTGSILAAKEGANILLTYQKSLPEKTLLLLKQENKQVTILGGTGSVGDEIVVPIMAFLPTERPILYFIPHQDDEILSFGVDIRNELSHGRNVQLILMTDGENSEARDLLNGQYDAESKDPNMAGELLNCAWHNSIHNPEAEYGSLGHLSFEEFVNLRTDEFKRALKALGVPEGQIHIESLHGENINSGNIESVIKKYLSLYPNADVRSLSWFDGHPTHSLIGQTIKSMQSTGLLNRYQAKYFLSIYTDRFYTVPKPMETQKEVLETESNKRLLMNAANEYKRFDPANGFFAIGYHSVSDQFDALMDDPYTEFYY